MKPIEQAGVIALAVVGVGTSDQAVLVGVGSLARHVSDWENEGTSSINGSPWVDHRRRSVATGGADQVYDPSSKLIVEAAEVASLIDIDVDATELDDSACAGEGASSKASRVSTLQLAAFSR